MKKIILGLFLTVGITGIALAENNLEVSKTKSETILTKNEQGNIEKKQIITYNYVNGVLFSCTIASHTYVYNICGERVATFRESREATGSECTAAGTVDGGLAISITRINNGFGDCHPEGPNANIN